MPEQSFDALVVGAGFAGAAAASVLQGAGLRTVVLEARSRAGGRAFTRTFTNSADVLEFGGAWVTPAQHRIRFTEPEVFDKKTGRNQGHEHEHELRLAFAGVAEEPPADPREHHQDGGGAPSGAGPGIPQSPPQSPLPEQGRSRSPG